MAKLNRKIEHSFNLAAERYEELGVSAEKALRELARIAISLHCWQGDDVGGFEKAGEGLGGGLAVTGNYPGKARTPDELRADLETRGLTILNQAGQNQAGPNQPACGRSQSLR